MLSQQFSAVIRLYLALLLLTVGAVPVFSGPAYAASTDSSETYLPDVDFLDTALPQGKGLSSKQPLLTILYNADTNGELFPCPT